jgi:hypothetical protein
MDTGSITIGAILIILIVVPFIFIRRSRIKAEQQLFNSLAAIAAEHGAKIETQATCGDLAIGLDTTKNMVFFHKSVEDRIVNQYLDLAEARACKVINISRKVAGKDGGSQVIDKVALAFVPKQASRAEMKFELYDSKSDLQHSGELQFSEEWCEKLNKRLAM